MDKKQLKKFKDFDFKQSEKPKRDQLFVGLKYGGGDGDYNEYDEAPLDIKFSEYKEHIDEINDILEKYQRMQEVLECGQEGKVVKMAFPSQKWVICDRRSKNRIETPIDDDLQDLLSMVPSDATYGDGDYKCYLESLSLIGYDENSLKHTFKIS